MQQRDRLSDDEAAVVFRRAAELDVHTGQSEQFDLDTIEEIGGLAGLSPDAIRQAVAELRAGGLPDEAVGGRHRLPAFVVAGRTVPGSPSGLVPRIEAYLGRQCLKQVRFGRHSVWVPKPGLLADLQRGLDLTGRLRFKDVGRLSVSVVEADGAAQSHVRMVADLKSYYRPLAATAVAVPLAGGVAGSIAAVAVWDPALLGLLPLGAGAGVAAGGWSAVRGAVLRRRAAIRETVAGFLDQLEQGL